MGYQMYTRRGITAGEAGKAATRTKAHLENGNYTHSEPKKMSWQKDLGRMQHKAWSLGTGALCQAARGNKDNSVDKCRARMPRRLTYQLAPQDGSTRGGGHQKRPPQCEASRSLTHIH